MYPVELGSEGTLAADTVQQKLTGNALDKGEHAVRLGITAHYLEMGKERTMKSDSYVLHYRVEGGGLFGGRSLRLVALSR